MGDVQERAGLEDGLEEVLEHGFGFEVDVGRQLVHAHNPLAVEHSPCQTKQVSLSEAQVLSALLQAGVQPTQ